MSKLHKEVILAWFLFPVKSKHLASETKYNACMASIVQNFKVANMIFPTYWENELKNPYVGDQFMISDIRGLYKRKHSSVIYRKKYSSVI